MNTGISRRYPALAFGLAVLAGVSAAALAGCGSISAGSGSSGGSAGPGGSAAQVSGTGATGPAKRAKPASRQAALCADTSAVTRLVVARGATINKIQVLHFPFPSQVTVTSAGHAQAVARALCGLPRMPAGVRLCPIMIFGTTYRLTFTAAGKPLPVVTVQSTGCQAVTGIGQVRRVANSPGFWRVLGTAIGLYGAGPPVFSGNGPVMSQCQTAAIRHVLINGCPAVMRPLSNPGPVS